LDCLGPVQLSTEATLQIPSVSAQNVLRVRMELVGRMVGWSAG